jgi:hypothetical protein
MKVQLARLFGSSSSEAMPDKRSDTQWRRTLRNVLGELERYLVENVATLILKIMLLFSKCDRTMSRTRMAVNSVS